VCVRCSTLRRDAQEEGSDGIVGIEEDNSEGYEERETRRGEEADNDLPCPLVVK